MLCTNFLTSNFLFLQKGSPLVKKMSFLRPETGQKWTHRISEAGSIKRDERTPPPYIKTYVEISFIGKRLLCSSYRKYCSFRIRKPQTPFFFKALFRVWRTEIKELCFPSFVSPETGLISILLSASRDGILLSAF